MTRPIDLLTDDELERSAVVANCRMNRERGLTGSNGYDRNIGFDPLDELRRRASESRPAAWLDLCCGSGKALIEAARIVHDEGLGVAIVGVDLVGMFLRPDPELTGLRLVEVRAAVSAVPGVAGLHDLHVWSMSNDDVSCTMHVTLAPGADPDTVRKAVAELVDERFGIEHATIQTEGPGEACEESEHLHD